MTPLLCAFGVAITLETQNIEKGHHAPSNLTFLFDRQKRFLLNERRRADLQNDASNAYFLIFASGLTYDLSKLSNDFTPLTFFRL